jgi:DNA modification methylase
LITVLEGDAREVLRTLPDASVHCCVTSPPYWGLRDYGVAGQLGLEKTPDEYVTTMVEVFREVRRVLRDDGVCFINLGDSYASGGTSPNRSRRPKRALACDSDGTAPPDYQASGSGCSGLCDECRDALSSHSARRTSLLEAALRRESEAARREASAGNAAPVSTKPRFLPPPLDGCSPMASREQCLLCGRSLVADARASGHTAEYKPDNVRLGSVFHNQDKGVSGSAPGCSTNASLKPKDLIGIPWMVAFALRADGWYLRKDIIWHKPNPMPESATDRPTSSHEHVFLMTKSPRYFFDGEAVREGRTQDEDANTFRGGSYVGGEPGKRITVGNKRIKVPGGWDQGDGAHGTIHRDGRTEATYQEVEVRAGRNIRDVWTIATAPFSEWTETVRQVRVAPDAPDDGKKRITSPDCPLHGDHPDQAPNVACGERAIGLFDDSERTAIRPVPGPQGGSEPIGMRHGQENGASKLGSLSRSYVQPATSHSTQIRKTDPVPATSLSCMPCDETLPHIADRSEERGDLDLAGRKPSSNSGPDDFGDHSSAQIVHHNEDTFSSGLSRCTCEYYIEKTEKTSHFATFAPELAERCIKAGSSEKGCCQFCRAPWVRIVTKGQPDLAHQRASGGDVNGEYAGQSIKDHDAAGVQNASDVKRRILEGMREKIYDWRPSCGCPIESGIMPCTILDPFGGAGTAGLVADRLGRDAILIELNPEYAAMARRRVIKDSPLFAEVK